MEGLQTSLCFLVLCHLLAMRGVNAQTCKTMAFHSLGNKKVLMHHSYQSIPTEQQDFCQGLCYMDDRCVSCNYDLQKKVCNLSNADDVMHPGDMVELPHVIYYKAENSCNCTGNSFCGYAPDSESFRCICKLGFSGANCDKDLDLVVAYPLNARHQARPLQSGLPVGYISNVKCFDENNGKTQGYCEFEGVKSSYIEIPNQVDGPLDLNGKMTIVLHVNIENENGPIFQYGPDRWGVHIFLVNNNFFVRLMNRDFTNLPNVQRPIPRGVWKFGGFTYDATTGVQQLWIDDQMVQTINVGQKSLATQDSVRLGATNYDGRHFRGKVACVQVYKRVLTAQEIKEARRLCRYLI